MVEVRVATGDIARTEADAVVVNLFKGARPGGATAAVDAATGGALGRLLEAGDFVGRFGEIAVLYPEGLAAPRVILVGLGDPAKFNLDLVRRAAARAARRARDMGLSTLATVVHGAGAGGLDAETAAQAVAEATVLATYDFPLYKSGLVKEPDEVEKRLATVTLVEADRRRAGAVRRGAAAGVAIAECVNFARDIATLSGREAHPQAIAARAKAMAKEEGLRCEVLGRKECEKLGMGAFLGVNQGSTVEPAFVVVEYTPARKTAPTFVVVGKGITFDTGGISIKPAADMDQMRFDKCGAAAALGLVRAASRLKLPVRVVAITPLTDNMPSGSAYKPGDVLKAMNGKTIEVMNTDAEGRLILADALAYADRFGPDAVVDLATLTGAASIALGTQASAMMGNNAELLARLTAAGEATHERVWELPFYAEYDEQLKSRVADVKNIGGRNAGTITGGKFLAKFVGDWPWAHLDIAATAWNDGKPEFNGDYSPTMATGVGVRLLAQMLRTWKPIKGYTRSRSARKGAPARSRPRKAR